MKLQIAFIGMFIFSMLSCKQPMKIKSSEKIRSIISEFKSEDIYDFSPYFKANLSTIILDSTKAITIRCSGGRLEEKTILRKLNGSEMSKVKKTFFFCKKYSIFGITKFPEYSIIETNLWDSTYLQLTSAHPNYHDPDIPLYHVTDPNNAHYKYSIIVLNRNSKLENIDRLKDMKLISFRKGVYLFRSFKNWKIDKFDLFDCTNTSI